jgi:hypothetical protein
MLKFSGGQDYRFKRQGQHGSSGLMGRVTTGAISNRHYKADFTDHCGFKGSRRRPPPPRIRDDLPDGQISTRDARLVSSPAQKNISFGDLLDAALLIPAVPP